MGQKVTIKWPYAPYPKQNEAIFGKERFSFIEGSTKSGKSSFSRIWLVQQTLQHLQQSAFISPVYQQAKDQFNHTVKLIEQFPKGTYTINKADLIIRFSFGGEIKFFSGDAPNSLYGYGFKSVVIDEASRVKKETWEAVLSTVSATQGKVRAIGNVYGRSNWFYKMCRQAEQGTLADSRYTKLTAQDVIDAGLRPANYLDIFRKTYPEEIFRELFFCEPSGNNANPFGSKNIEAIIGPMSKLSPFVWGVDVAQTQNGGDATCLIALDKNGAVCRFYHERINGPEVIKMIKEKIKRSELMYIDGTAIGKMVYDSLMGSFSGNIKWTSYIFTAEKKQILMETLRAGIVDKAITIPEGEISKELDNFEYKYENGRIKYEAPAGLHDDAVMALALAYKCYVDNRWKTASTSEAFVNDDIGIADDLW